MSPEDIRDLRDRLGLSQQGLADRVNIINPLLRVNRQTVYRWERGTQAPNVHSLVALRRVATEFSRCTRTKEDTPS